MGIWFSLGLSIVVTGGVLLIDALPAEQYTRPVAGNATFTAPPIAPVALPVTIAGASNQVATGQMLYQRKCGACHSLDKNRVGPRHRNIYTRQVASVPGYRYSKALKELKIKWTEKNLNAWLKNPTALAPGTSMGFRLTKESEREAIIAYLKSVSQKTK